MVRKLQLDCESSDPSDCLIETEVFSFDADTTDTPAALTIDDQYLSCTVATDFLPAFGFLSVLPERINSKIVYRLEYQT